MDKKKIAQDYLRDLVNRDTEVPGEYHNGYYWCSCCGCAVDSDDAFCGGCGQRLGKMNANKEGA